MEKNGRVEVTLLEMSLAAVIVFVINVLAYFGFGLYGGFISWDQLW